MSWFYFIRIRVRLNFAKVKYCKNVSMVLGKINLTVKRTVLGCFTGFLLSKRTEFVSTGFRSFKLFHLVPVVQIVK
ncbi:MAG: hypothetical protein DWQ02_04560 [Bacteroidetes bacterium]|nr:MAG: hypothetical protein DWQ02_04560 [Bacteroidota bacterium]